MKKLALGMALTIGLLLIATPAHAATSRDSGICIWM
ncbi:hypothetical protein F4556_006865 [Kitasatospora gansuensis]|uniref:Uncharacterized protein n=1 Tax=Kitasatospora gansuensis TaxID=258050 RepID=A0A7W7WLQ6_9ACTN|nr:hypothetical protein [Kitasatospora gansuensis]